MSGGGGGESSAIGLRVNGRMKTAYFGEQHATVVARIPNATDAMIAAAKRVLALQPDAGRLAPMIFGGRP